MFNVSLFNLHAPTEDKETEIKEVFYGNLEIVYNNAPQNDVKIVLDDCNAKVGHEKQYRRVIGFMKSVMIMRISR